MKIAPKQVIFRPKIKVKFLNISYFYDKFENKKYILKNKPNQQDIFFYIFSYFESMGSASFTG